MIVFLLRFCLDHEEGWTMGVFSTLEAAQEHAKQYRWEDGWVWYDDRHGDGWYGGKPSWPDYNVTRHTVDKP